MIEEETALLKQKKLEFEFEKATFNKQTEFAKNVLKRQDDELKVTQLLQQNKFIIVLCSDRFFLSVVKRRHSKGI